jgi:NADH:ubiquinone oxidoreductase subunit 3 (subunit A)
MLARELLSKLKLNDVLANFTILVIRNIVIFSLLFWLITFSLKYFYSNKSSKYKLNFYECGFKSLNSIKVEYNINFILIVLFVLIYDGEFLLLFPCALNIEIANYVSVLILTIFLIWLIIAIVVDFMLNSLEWQL